MNSALAPTAILADLWRHGGLPTPALNYAAMTGSDPVFASSFAVGAAAQTSIAAAALAACEFGHLRGQLRQQVAVDMAHAALECTGWFSLDGKVPALWDKFSGLYACADGWVRIHTNFAHHRDGALRLMGLNAVSATRADAEQAMRTWRAAEFEQAAADAGLVVAALRSFDEWDAHPQGQAVAALPLMTFERIGDAPPNALPSLETSDLPLTHLRVLDLTRILAGPVCGRALAAYGADVMLINAPHLPNIESIADTSRGKLSAHVDLRTADGKATLANLVGQAQVFVQGYRPGALEALGFGPEDLARLNLAKSKLGVVCVSLSAYGHTGPWATRRGFDSLVQTAMGFNHAEGLAASASDGSKGGAPKPLPMQILDYATGHLMAFAASAALYRQAREGGSWHVRLSLAQTGHWLRGLGLVSDGFGVKPPDRRLHLEQSASGFGELIGIRHSAQLAATPSFWRRPSVPPGTSPPCWPA